MIKWFATFILVCLFSSPSFSDNFLQLDVVQSRFVFDNTDIKSVNILMPDGVYQGLHIQLKPEAVTAMERMTKDAIGKRLNLVFNDKIISTTIIQTSLGGDLRITGISKSDAEEFIASLNHNKPKPPPETNDDALITATMNS